MAEQGLRNVVGGDFGQRLADRCEQITERLAQRFGAGDDVLQEGAESIGQAGLDLLAQRAGLQLQLADFLGELLDMQDVGGVFGLVGQRLGGGEVGLQGLGVLQIGIDDLLARL